MPLNKSYLNLGDKFNMFFVKLLYKLSKFVDESLTVFINLLIFSVF